MPHITPPLARLSDTQTVSIRFATAADARAIARLAALDSSRPPRGRVLLGEIEGELWAALGVEDRHGISDPFRPAREILALLRARAKHVSRERPPLAALRPGLAA